MPSVVSPARVRTRLRAPATALWWLGVLALTLGVVEGFLLPQATPEIAAVLPIFPVLGLLYVVIGCVAWSRRPSNRVGAVLILGGLTWFVSGLSNSGVPVLIALGEISAVTPFAVLVHLVLIYPTGRTGVRGSRVVIAAAYATTLVLQAPRYLFAQDRPDSPLFVLDRPDLFELGTAMQTGATVVVLLATGALLVQRYRSATPSVRRALRPVAGYGYLALVLIPVSASVLTPLLDLDPIALFVVQAVVLALVPFAFLLGVLLGGYARTGEVVELASWFRRSVSARTEPATALARVLGDPDVTVLYWLESRRAYATAAGSPVDLPEGDTSRRVSPITVDGRRIGAVVYDEGLVGDVGLVEEAGQALAVALDRQRLLVELVDSREALTRSRTRIVEADEQARHRIARDLHDGLQGRLVLLAIQAGRLGALSDEPEVQAAATELRTGLEGAIQQLRGMVRDVVPALLLERGLEAAVRELTEGMPVPTELVVVPPVGRFPATLESAAFFVVAETLANALKHADAERVDVFLAVDDDELRLMVTDDGRGGATAGSEGGLQSLVDRVEALGGWMIVTSPADRGTRVEVGLPCEW